MQEDFHPEEAKITNDEKNTGILIHILGLFLGIISPPYLLFSEKRILNM